MVGTAGALVGTAMAFWGQRSALYRGCERAGTVSMRYQRNHQVCGGRLSACRSQDACGAVKRLGQHSQLLRGKV